MADSLFVSLEILSVGNVYLSVAKETLARVLGIASFATLR